MTRRAVFLDRDGVINRYRSDYVRSPEDFEYYDHTAEAFAILGSLGLPIVVVTNQSGIGRGYTTPEIVDAVHERLRRDAAAWGAPIDSIEVCPHLPTDGCDCRKPGDALFRRAAASGSLALEGSFLVGDSPSDIEAAVRLGIRAVRVATGRGGEALPDGIAPEATVDDLLAAARWIAARTEEGNR